MTVASKTDAKVTFADVSKYALKVTKYNAERIGVSKKKIKYVCTDMFGKVRGRYDLIVCNPPYISTDVIPTLDESVKDYEPHSALDGGRDGLDFYRILAEKAGKHLTDGGKLYMEIGYDQGESVPALFKKNYDVVVLKDYSGNDRMVLATKRK